jgi:IS1 family transposase
LLVQTRERLADPHGLVLFTDGFLSYQTLFPEVFGRPYRPARQGTRGRFPKTAYRVPRSSAHVRIIKEYSGKRVVSVRTEIAAGTRTRVHEELQRLGYRKPNTSAVERQNATARRMNPHLARKSLAFARLTVHRVSLAHLVQGTYNWCRTQRGLRKKLDVPKGRQQYLQRTPAMAIGLTDRVWTLRAWLSRPRGVSCRA